MSLFVCFFPRSPKELFGAYKQIISGLTKEEQEVFAEFKKKKKQEKLERSKELFGTETSGSEASNDELLADDSSSSDN